MRTVRTNALVAVALAFTLGIALPVTPATAESDLPERAEQALRESLQKFMRTLEWMIRAFPQYDVPEILDNGDIIIRRKPRRDDNPVPRLNDDETVT